MAERPKGHLYYAPIGIALIKKAKRVSFNECGQFKVVHVFQNRMALSRVITITIFESVNIKSSNSYIDFFNV